MIQPDEISSDAYNTAIAQVLLERKKDIGMTFPDLALFSGIPKQQVMRLVNGHRTINTGDFVVLCLALNIPPAKVIQAAAELAANTAAKSNS